MKEAAPNNKLLAIASVPYQSFDCIYSFDDALKIGTIFPELNMPFFAAETSCPKPMEKGECPLPKEDAKDLKTLISQINCISFALDDLTLFLDTHPNETEALQLFKKVLEKKNELVKEFSQLHYPLDKNSINPSLANKAPFNWTNGPMPWEGAKL